MKFTRIMGELILASGAIAGILFITAPPLPSISAQLPLSATAPQPANAENELGLDKLVGIAQFVKNPTQYHVVSDNRLATITAASLKGDRMTIHYTYPNAVTGKTGSGKTEKLIGTVNSDGIFSGTHLIESQSVESQSAKNPGNVTFTFAADGTAKSTGAKGVETTIFSLQKNQQSQSQNH